MCNPTHLCVEGQDLSTWLAGPEIREPHIFKDLLRRLRSISISDPNLDGGDWSPLTDFLARCTAVGNQISFFSLSGYPHMGEGVVDSIRRAVEIFEDGGRNRHC